MRFDVLTVLEMSMSTFWVVTPCGVGTVVQPGKRPAAYVAAVFT